VITLFAIPAGIASGRQSVFKGIVGALVMFFAFYALVIGGMVCADVGLIPPVPAAVLPHLVFLAVGICLFRRQR
jgi:lipopolysaccharide export LptBFGC system permease protein LptF